MRHRIVKFGDKYALEKGRRIPFICTVWTGKYKDFSMDGRWWRSLSPYFHDCLVDLETIERTLVTPEVIREVRL